jgi:hypothetical protein
MRKSYSKIRHIQEANKLLEDRLIKEGLKSIINEAFLPIIQQGDDLCDILCGRKQAKYGSNGDAVKKIQNGLSKCGYNPNKMGGGINQGCGEDWTKCDGKFREETKKATEDFQRSNGLKVDGAVGYNTLIVMGKKCLELPKCDCNEQGAGNNGNQSGDNNNNNNGEGRSDWWNLVDFKGPKMDDCNTINRCLYKAIERCRTYSKSDCFRQTFFQCMKDGGPNTEETSLDDIDLRGTPTFDV